MLVNNISMSNKLYNPGATKAPYSGVKANTNLLNKVECDQVSFGLNGKLSPSATLGMVVLVIAAIAQAISISLSSGMTPAEKDALFRDALKQMNEFCQTTGITEKGNDLITERDVIGGDTPEIVIDDVPGAKDDVILFCEREGAHQGEIGVMIAGEPLYFASNETDQITAALEAIN